MQTYDYEAAVREDMQNYFYENRNYYDFSDDFESLLEYFKEDENGIIERVTGNRTGSYFCCAYKAEEALLHNMNIINDILDSGLMTIEEIFCHDDYWNPERIDVIIRYYFFEQFLEEELSKFVSGLNGNKATV